MDNETPAEIGESYDGFGGEQEIFSGDRKTFEQRSGVDLSKDGSGMLEYIAPLRSDDVRMHYHMFSDGLHVRDRWLLACGNERCPTSSMIPLPLVEVWKRAATPHQIWLLNWQQRCEATLAVTRKANEA